MRNRVRQNMGERARIKRNEGYRAYTEWLLIAK
jgi:hypothetical protein